MKVHFQVVKIGFYFTAKEKWYERWSNSSFCCCCCCTQCFFVVVAFRFFQQALNTTIKKKSYFISHMMMMMSWCLMSSDVIWRIRDKLWPMPKHGSIKSTYVRCMRVLAVTCHLHFWQNDRDFLRATVVTRGWNGYRNKSQHRKSTLEKKILPPFQQGFSHIIFNCFLTVSLLLKCHFVAWRRGFPWKFASCCPCHNK